MVTLRSAMLYVLVAVLICGCIIGCRNATTRVANRAGTASAPTESEKGAETSSDQPPQADHAAVPDADGSYGDQSIAQPKPELGRILPPDHPLRGKWPRPVLTGVLSPDGKTVAIHDDAGIFLTDQKGGNVRRVKITLLEKLANEQVAVLFAFRPDSRRVAILTRLSYGEPMGAFIERLWTADVATGCSRRLSEWSDRFQGSGPIVAERSIEGWTRDGKSIVVSAVIYEGDMPAEMHRIGTKRAVVRDMPCK